MSRNIDSFLEKPWPPVGKIEATCLDAKLLTSKTKKTSYIKLTWENPTGEYQWSDRVFCTVKAVRRLALVAKHICGFTAELPDSDDDAMGILTDFILANIIGKRSLVTIEEKEEIFIPESGPDMGRKVTTMKKKVAFSGYEKPETTISAVEGKKKEITKEDSDSIPF